MPVAPADTDVGDIAVIESDATILEPGELFDLNNSSITFTPRVGGGYNVTAGALNFESTLGASLGMTDDDSKEQLLSFSFPFFGTNYSSVFINSNGHLTFVQSRPDDTHYNDLCGGDVSNVFNASLCPTAVNVLDVVAEDLPRIVPLWQDWNPSAGGGVFVRSLADRLVVTWSEVPLFGTGSTASFQVVLFGTGLIRMNYKSVTTTPGGGYLVGISPGSSSPFITTTVDFSQGLGSSISNCVLFGMPCPNLEPLVQVFGSTPNPLVQIAAVARKFYKAHGDQIDQFVMFANFPNAMGNAFAFELNINPDVVGIGLDPLNISPFYGSQGRLVSFLNMNRLALYPADPNEVFLFGDNNTLDLMGQEAGHNWLAFVNFDDGGVCSNLLLGRQLAHWSFFHDSDASDMEGNKWQDNGDGTFTTIEATERYSALDQYIMGVRPSSEVPNFFFIRNPSTVGCFVFDSAGERSCAPQVGVTVTGTRQDVTLSQIQTCEGSRSPEGGFSATNPTTTWRQAFILLIPGGTSVPQTDIDKIETIRSAWVPYFNAATSGRGFIDTTLPTLASSRAPADFNGDGVSDIGVYRDGGWYLDLDGNDQWDGCVVDGCYVFGLSGDQAVVGDWTGSGQAKIGVYRDGGWYLDLDGNGQWDGCIVDGCYVFGLSGDQAVVGDWTGSGQAKIGVYRDGGWYLDLNGNGQWDGCGVDGCVVFGLSGDQAVVGDWTGSGQAKIGVYRDGGWYLDLNGNGQWDGCSVDGCFVFGLSGDQAVVGDWTGSGTVKIGVYRDGGWYLDLNGNGQWDGCSVDVCVGYGLAGDLAIN